MAITNGYATLTDFKNLKRVTDADATDDAIIEDLIEAASRYIDGQAYRRFWVNTNDETRTYQAANNERVYTDDIVSVTTLKTDDYADRTYTTSWAATDYDLLPANAALEGWPYTYIQRAPFGNYSFNRYPKGVQIVGKFGFSAVPDDIKTACLMIVSNMYSNRFGQSTTGAATVTAAGVVITSEDIPASATELIKKYRRLV